ncbi:MAG: hypothetical protein U0325_26180 [Polyangiales bacterium]
MGFGHGRAQPHGLAKERLGVGEAALAKRHLAQIEHRPRVARVEPPRRLEARARGGELTALEQRVARGEFPLGRRGLGAHATDRDRQPRRLRERAGAQEGGGEKGPCGAHRAG